MQSLKHPVTIVCIGILAIALILLAIVRLMEGCHCG